MHACASPVTSRTGPPHLGCAGNIFILFVRISVCELRLLTRSKYFSRNILFSRKIVFCIRRYYKLPLRDVVRLKSRESCTCVALPTKTQKLGPNYAKTQIWDHLYPLLKLCTISRSSTITPARQLICIPPPCDGVSGALTAVWQIGSSFGYLEAPRQCR